MRYGLSLPNGGVCGDARVLAELGILAEEAGWDGVFVEDYIVHQSDGAVPTCDPWIALAAMAVGTQACTSGHIGDAAEQTPTLEGRARGRGAGPTLEWALHSWGRFR